MEYLADKLRAGRTIYTSWHGIAHSDVVDAVAASGLECVVLDVQHGGIDFASLLSIIPVATYANCAVGVRIAAGDYAFAARAVDAGAQLVIAPLVNTADDARELVQAVKYPPLGGRSWGPGRAMRYSGVKDPHEQLARANDHVLAFAMIETLEGIENVDEIIAVEGIDGILVGPSDLSIALSNGEKFDAFGEQSMPVIKMIGEKVRAAGKFAAIFSINAKDTVTSEKLGYRLISIGMDKGFIASGLASALGAIEKAKVST